MATGSGWVGGNDVDAIQNGQAAREAAENQTVPGETQRGKADRVAAAERAAQGDTLTNDKIQINDASNPGSAEVGGYSSGSQDLHDQALAQMHQGDGAYYDNQAAMGRSIGNMSADRGVVSPENAALLGRDAASRQQQIGSLDLQRNAAMGGAPSAAAYQTRGALDASMAGQAGSMGSAHGLAGLTGAQGVGAAQTGLSSGSAAIAGGMGRSKEIADSIGMYGSSASAVRAGDMNRLQQGDSNSLGNADLNNQWKLGNAALAAKQGQLGVEQDKTRGAWYDASAIPEQNQAKYDQIMQAMQHGQSSADASAAVAQAGAERDRNRKLAGGAVQGGLTLLGTAAGGPVGGAAGGIGGGMANSYISGGGLG